MDAFSANPPEWTNEAKHSLVFCCPNCKAKAESAVGVWLNRRAPVTDSSFGRKWQEFYLCECETAWWAWSSDRPPSKENQNKIGEE